MLRQKKKEKEKSQYIQIALLYQLSHDSDCITVTTHHYYYLEQYVFGGKLGARLSNNHLKITLDLFFGQHFFFHNRIKYNQVSLPIVIKRET